MSTRDRFRPTAAPWLTIALFVGLALQFAFATPIFEAPDETQHISFVARIANRWLLLNQIQSEHAAEQEGSQPPLFYAAAALVLTPFERSNLDTLRQKNPHAQTGNPAALINRNTMLQHDPYPVRLDPPRGAIYAIRLLNVLFGAITVWAVWKAARTAAPDRPAVATLASGLTALNPQFAFIAGAVNNDVMAAMWGSLIVWQTLALLRDGFSLNRSLTLGVLVALASMTKVSGLLFGVLVGIAAAWLLWRRRDWRGFATLAASGLLFWATIAGSWYVRNLTLYNDFTGTSTMLRWVGARPPISAGNLIREIGSLTISYWGIFGWFNLLTPRLYYYVVDILLVAAAGGIGIGLWRVRRDLDRLQVWAFLLLTFLLGLAALVVWTLTTYGTQGRLLFPYVAAIHTLLAFGLTTIRVPPRPLLAALGIFAYLLPLTLIVPAYTPPPPVAELPPQALPFGASWGRYVSIAGHDPIEGEFARDEFVPVTVYWQPLDVADRDYSLYLHVIGPDGTILGQVDSYPNGGLRRTTQWLPAAIYPDSYLIELTEPVPAGAPLRLVIGWYDHETGERLPAFDGNGGPAPLVSVPAGKGSSG